MTFEGFKTVKEWPSIWVCLIFPHDQDAWFPASLAGNDAVSFSMYPTRWHKTSVSPINADANWSLKVVTWLRSLQCKVTISPLWLTMKYLFPCQIFNLFLYFSISVWAHGFLFYSMDYHSQSSFIFTLKLSHIWPVGAPLSWYLFFTCPHHFLSTSLLSDTRYFRLILYSLAPALESAIVFK